MKPKNKKSLLQKKSLFKPIKNKNKEDNHQKHLKKEFSLQKCLKKNDLANQYIDNFMSLETDNYINHWNIKLDNNCVWNEQNDKENYQTIHHFDHTISSNFHFQIQNNKLQIYNNEYEYKPKFMPNLSEMYLKKNLSHQVNQSNDIYSNYSDFNLKIKHFNFFKNKFSPEPELIKSRLKNESFNGKIIGSIRNNNHIFSNEKLKNSFDNQNQKTSSYFLKKRQFLNEDDEFNLMNHGKKILPNSLINVNNSHSKYKKIKHLMNCNEKNSLNSLKEQNEKHVQNHRLILNKFNFETTPGYVYFKTNQLNKFYQGKKNEMNLNFSFKNKKIIEEIKSKLASFLTTLRKDYGNNFEYYEYDDKLNDSESESNKNENLIKVRDLISENINDNIKKIIDNSYFYLKQEHKYFKEQFFNSILKNLNPLKVDDGFILSNENTYKIFNIQYPIKNNDFKNLDYSFRLKFFCLFLFKYINRNALKKLFSNFIPEINIIQDNFIKLKILK